VVDVGCISIGSPTPPTSPLVGPWGVKVTPDGMYAYVTNPGNNTVSVIKTATNKIVRTISDPSFNEPLDLAITPDGTKVFVVNLNSSTVSVISTATNKVIANYVLPDCAPANPLGIAISSDGETAIVVVNYAGGLGIYKPNYLIDIATGTITETTGDFVAGFFVIKSGEEFVASCDGLLFINRYTGVQVQPSTYQQPLGYATGLSVSPDGTWYFQSAGPGNIGIPTVLGCYWTEAPIPPDPSNLVGQIVIDDLQGEHAITDEWLYAACNHGDSIVAVSYLDIEQGIDPTIIRIPVGAAPIGLGLTPDNGHLYVANQGANTVVVIDTSTNWYSAIIINTWSKDTSYVVGNEVAVAGVNYVCILDNPAEPVSVSPPDVTFWAYGPVG
jgi:YVTN family beta-propeller protein